MTALNIPVIGLTGRALPGPRSSMMDRKKAWALATVAMQCYVTAIPGL